MKKKIKRPVFGDQNNLSSEEVRQLEDYQRALTDHRHIARVNSFIQDAWCEAIKETEHLTTPGHARSRLFVQKMNEKCQEAGLRYVQT